MQVTHGKMEVMSVLYPTIIAIETSSDLASVALLRENQMIWQETPGSQTHSMTVPRMLHALLEQANLSLKLCDALAFGAGPGSFTGVRTACGLAQGMAFGASLPAAPVVTLLAMAERARLAGAGNEVLAMLDARMGEVYWAQYRFDQGWHVVTAPTLSSAAQVVSVGSPAVCGNGLSQYGDQLNHLNLTRSLPDVIPHASDIARLGAELFLKGSTVHARDAQPIYLRNKVALTTLERLAGART
jgi:tRNA threonylcarbamoyladenosine biosynthesis protein TsaB